MKGFVAGAIAGAAAFWLGLSGWARHWRREGPSDFVRVGENLGGALICWVVYRAQEEGVPGVTEDEIQERVLNLSAADAIKGVGFILEAGLPIPEHERVSWPQ